MTSRVTFAADLRLRVHEETRFTLLETVCTQDKVLSQTLGAVAICWTETVVALVIAALTTCVVHQVCAVRT